MEALEASDADGLSVKGVVYVDDRGLSHYLLE